MMPNDTDMLRGAVENAHRGRQPQVHWSHVSDLLAIGSTSAIALCRRFDVDPDKETGTPVTLECDACKGTGMPAGRHAECQHCDGKGWVLNVDD